jgi:hypothetical protein
MYKHIHHNVFYLTCQVITEKNGGEIRIFGIGYWILDLSKHLALSRAALCGCFFLAGAEAPPKDRDASTGPIAECGIRIRSACNPF